MPLPKGLDCSASTPLVRPLRKDCDLKVSVVGNQPIDQSFFTSTDLLYIRRETRQEREAWLDAIAKDDRRDRSGSASDEDQESYNTYSEFMFWET